MSRARLGGGALALSNKTAILAAAKAFDVGLAAAGGNANIIGRKFANNQVDALGEACSLAKYFATRRLKNYAVSKSSLAGDLNSTDSNSTKNYAVTTTSTARANITASKSSLAGYLTNAASKCTKNYAAINALKFALSSNRAKNWHAKTSGSEIRRRGLC